MISRSSRSRSPAASPPAPLRAGEGVRLDHVPLGDDELFVLSAPSGSRASRVEGLFSPAESEVVRLVLRGWSNERIATETGRATRTVSNLLARACRKLGVTRRTELAHALALQAASVETSSEGARIEPQ